MTQHDYDGAAKNKSGNDRSGVYKMAQNGRTRPPHRPKAA